jgi:hypothetical protein
MEMDTAELMHRVPRGTGAEVEDIEMDTAELMHRVPRGTGAEVEDIEMDTAELMHRIPRGTGAEVEARRRRTGSANSRRSNEEIGAGDRRKRCMSAAEDIQMDTAERMHRIPRGTGAEVEDI